jgi:hypothetical protein
MHTSMHFFVYPTMHNKYTLLVVYDLVCVGMNRLVSVFV